MHDKSNVIVIQSHGMGVESQAIFERWVAEPETRPFERWDQLTIVTAQVGEEHKKDTIPLMEKRTLPLCRALGIRFVELARKGHLEDDGIVVLQDTRDPWKLHPDGIYKLSDEQLMSGTVPQFGGEHRCAMKFKAFVIETWLAWEFRGEQTKPVYHIFGYNYDEQSRINNSNFHIARHNEDRKIETPGRKPIEVFGFNFEEQGRILRSKKYDGPTRTGLYPLDDWQWPRKKCLDYIKEKSGLDWKKSHCAFCLTGDTEVITRDGIRQIRDLVDTSPELLVPTPNGHFKTGEHGGKSFQSCGDWVAAPIRHFGEQPIVELKLRRGRSEKIVRCTPEHRWLLDIGVKVATEGLLKGQSLAVCFRPLIARSASPVRPSAIGIAQGFTFGDGSRAENERYACHVPFYGEKDKALLPYFSTCCITKAKANGKEILVAKDIPRYWKDTPPLRESRSFLFGWLAGYFAADGDVVKKGNQATLCSSERKNLEFVRDVCVVLGVETHPIREKKNPNRFPNAKPLYSIGLRVEDLPDSFWVIPEHKRRVISRPPESISNRKRWVVVSKKSAGVEEVYCATVEGRELFTLADNLVTGNCPFCAEAAKGEENAVQRWLHDPEQAAHGLLVEYNSLCFNPRGHLYRDRAMIDVIRRENLTPVLEAFEKRLKDMEWGLYKVRRIYTKKGKAMRCVELVRTGTRKEMSVALLGSVTEVENFRFEELRGITYLRFQERVEDVYPSCEGFYVIAPKFMQTKVRGPIERFNERWERAVSGQPLAPVKETEELEEAAA